MVGGKGGGCYWGHSPSFTESTNQSISILVGSGQIQSYLEINLILRNTTSAQCGFVITTNFLIGIPSPNNIYLY